MHQLLLDCEKMRYSHTGLFEFCKHLGNALIRNKATNEEITFYLPSQLSGFFGKKEQYLVNRPFHKLWIPPQKKIDIWHTTFQTSGYMPLGRNMKQVLTIHDLNLLHEKKSPKKEERYLKKIQRNIDKADHIVTISRFTMEDVKRHLDLKDKPTSVVMNGNSLEAYPEFDNPVYRPAKPFLFAIGSINEKKNFHVLPSLLVNNDYELIIAGPVFDENYKQKILTDARAHGVQDRVKILGSINDTDKYWYFVNCLGFLFPSLAEGFGLPVAEAMSLGKPVFISDKTSLPEIGGTYAYYFHNFEPTTMQKVFIDGLHHYQVNNMANAIKAHSDTLTFDKTAQGYLQVYRSLY
ncbi:Glycosyltransferase involved in cell wall bisynthesis [Chitinophaga sp. CF118]|uniref:glycosyltransferase family 4 protein n=1 Tax=Chitinophaga sp. CF118 TaxID=1884367 RepID=UPI0008F3C86C|nr:glycosyltransferase family 1 protein [Chitinophaga sp. CF118]SFD30460.1 Glycosyltransferase involved in cell wall bisynthesis [Chitinophaga sp. CF118]